MKIAVVGLGYVGLSNAILLSQNNEVWAVDIVPEKIKMINNKKLPIMDKDMEEYLLNRSLNLISTTDAEMAYKDSDYIIISTPTNYDSRLNYFDTSTVENVIKQIIGINPFSTIVIRSTVPIGFTEDVQKKYNFHRILFCPEFLREGRALYDNLYPARIIVGCNLVSQEAANKFAKLLVDGAKKRDIPVLSMNTTEAEAVKLFANAFLALRITYFNELDTFAEIKNLDSRSIIEGISLDPRIGMCYNNPSFGYGGYCLPKDTKQLVANFNNVPNNVISAIFEANQTRKRYIADRIIKFAKGSGKENILIGIYRLIMKSESDNCRQCAVQDIINILKSKAVNILIFEPTLDKNEFGGSIVTHDLNYFKKVCDIIVANRYSKEIDDVAEKVYTRDIFFRD